jgi:hypothetical protein
MVVYLPLTVEANIVQDVIFDVEQSRAARPWSQGPGSQALAPKRQSAAAQPLSRLPHRQSAFPKQSNDSADLGPLSLITHKGAVLLVRDFPSATPLRPDSRHYDRLMFIIYTLPSRAGLASKAGRLVASASKTCI